MRMLTLALCFTGLVACTSKTPAPSTSTEPSGTPISEAAPGATNWYQVGQSLYNHALAGLTLRATPDQQGAKKASLPYGMSVEVVELPGKAQAYTAESYGPYALSGYWVKVKTPQNEVGYVFDGYLAPFPVIREEPEEDQSVEESFYRQLAQPRQRETIKADASKGIVKHYRTPFSDGGEYEFILYNGGVTSYLRIPTQTLTFNQALVALRSMCFYDKNKKTTTTWDAEGKKIRITQPEEGYYWMELAQEGNQLVAGFFSAD